MLTWLKPEHVITILIGFCTVTGVGFTNWVTSHDKGVLSDRDMVTMQKDVATIREAIAPVPLYVQRIVQLENWKEEQKSQFERSYGGLDARLRTVEGISNESKTKVDAIFAASGLSPDGRKMR